MNAQLAKADVDYWDDYGRVHFLYPIPNVVFDMDFNPEEQTPTFQQAIDNALDAKRMDVVEQLSKHL